MSGCVTTSCDQKRNVVAVKFRWYGSVAFQFVAPVRLRRAQSFLVKFGTVQSWQSWNDGSESVPMGRVGSSLGSRV